MTMLVSVVKEIWYSWVALTVGCMYMKMERLRIFKSVPRPVRSPAFMYASVLIIMDLVTLVSLQKPKLEFTQGVQYTGRSGSPPSTGTYSCT